jgi:hypothetical protein
MCVFPRARDVIQEEPPSREPPLVFHSVSPWGVSRSSDETRWSLFQQYYRVPSVYKTE